MNTLLPGFGDDIDFGIGTPLLLLISGMLESSLSFVQGVMKKIFFQSSSVGTFSTENYGA